MEYLLEIVVRFLTRIFSPRPHIGKEGGLLVVESTWRTALLSLGSRHRRVVVDPKNRTIRCADRAFWFFKSTRRIEFDWIAEVFYTYHDLMDSGMFSHFSQDLFCVGVKLKDGSNITLFRFFGEGEFTNESLWPDWMYWDQMAIGKIAAHSQESESRNLVDVLCALIDVPLSNEI